MSGLATSPRRIAAGFHLVRITLGVLLLIAAGLKAVDVWSGQPPSPLLPSPRWQIALIEVETLLGLWLLSGVYPRGAWLAAIGLFTTLAGFSLYLALEGQRWCKCFGDILRVSPWLTFGLDVAAVTALLVFRPAGTHSHIGGAWLRGIVHTALGAAIFLALIGSVVLLAADDLPQALARLRNESITVDPAVSEVGEGRDGEQRQLTFQLTNRTDRPIRVVGGTTAGYCVATIDLPITLPPGGARSIRVRATIRGGTGRFHHQFVLYTDDQKQPVVTAAFTGRVIEAPSK
jgi:hypothetical protein